MYASNTCFFSNELVDCVLVPACMFNSLIEYVVVVLEKETDSPSRIWSSPDKDCFWSSFFISIFMEQHFVICQCSMHHNMSFVRIALAATGIDFHNPLRCEYLHHYILQDHKLHRAFFRANHCNAIWGWLWRKKKIVFFFVYFVFCGVSVTLWNICI